ncbi:MULTISPECIES: DUF1428 domain-containing protein [Litoreibacter]|uniref:Uncharacterized conserved protein YbaA, DUF1428 family n=1 Tax=Litoreibacter ascidiaceicola TaxID=1486859 RepID=A0A1M5EMA9_9RHOB|nr:DUF1428 domain-containing protein [Litoreibacter ascidiaceicola]SHF80284.1 Uncharacterized conserved protein YbaA, DUF1428 family [Litoreibacter ascidiaceicola]
MSYIQGLLIPVPTKNKDAYKKLAELAAPIFQDYGALRIVEAWGDAVPDGKVTDFKRAVKAEDGETVVFSWIEWPDKQTYESAAEKMETDPRWGEMPEMPFDGKRMMWAGFAPILDTTG